MEWLFWWLSPFTLWGIFCTGVVTYSYINEHRKKELPKSETLLFLEEQNEWGKQLTADRRRRDKDRASQHRDWNDEARELYKKQRKWGYIPDDAFYETLLDGEYRGLQSYSVSLYQDACERVRAESKKREAFERKFLLWLGLEVDK